MDTYCENQKRLYRAILETSDIFTHTLEESPSLRWQAIAKTVEETVSCDKKCTNPGACTPSDLQGYIVRGICGCNSPLCCVFAVHKNIHAILCSTTIPKTMPKLPRTATHLVFPRLTGKDVLTISTPGDPFADIRAFLLELFSLSHSSSCVVIDEYYALVSIACENQPCAVHELLEKAHDLQMPPISHVSYTNDRRICPKTKLLITTDDFYKLIMSNFGPWGESPYRFDAIHWDMTSIISRCLFNLEDTKKPGSTDYHLLQFLNKIYNRSDTSSIIDGDGDGNKLPMVTTIRATTFQRLVLNKLYNYYPRRMCTDCDECITMECARCLERDDSWTYFIPQQHWHNTSRMVDFVTQKVSIGIHDFLEEFLPKQEVEA